MAAANALGRILEDVSDEGLRFRAFAERARLSGALYDPLMSLVIATAERRVLPLSTMVLSTRVLDDLGGDGREFVADLATQVTLYLDRGTSESEIAALLEAIRVARALGGSRMTEFFTAAIDDGIDRRIRAAINDR